MTSKDMDRFTEGFFQEWKVKPDAIEDETDKCISLVKAASIAREKCKLKFLNGAAPVIYGIPCYLK